MYTVPMYIHICSVTIYVHIVIYSVHSVAMHIIITVQLYIYTTDTVPHCIVTLCSPYTLSLCSITNLTKIIQHTKYHYTCIHCHYTMYTCNINIQCTHCHYKIYTVSLYSVTICIVHISTIKYAQCHYTVYTLSLYIVNTVTMQCGTVSVLYI